MLLRSSEKNLDSNKPFEIEFTDECIEEMLDIYEYISNHLKENNIAKRLMTEVIDKILDLANGLERYVKIGKVDKLKREYHRMVFKKYVILYTIDFEKRKVYISRMVYGRRNYLNN